MGKSIAGSNGEISLVLATVDDGVTDLVERAGVAVRGMIIRSLPALEALGCGGSRRRRGTRLESEREGMLALTVLIDSEP